MKKMLTKPYGNAVKPNDMTTKYIYRVVEIKTNSIVWMSDKFSLSREDARKRIDALASELESLYGHTAEDIHGHRWDSFTADKCGKEQWYTVEKVKRVTDRRGRMKVYGFIMYEIDEEFC